MNAEDDFYQRYSQTYNVPRHDRASPLTILIFSVLLCFVVHYISLYLGLPIKAVWKTLRYHLRKMLSQVGVAPRRLPTEWPARQSEPSEDSQSPQSAGGILQNVWKPLNAVQNTPLVSLLKSGVSQAPPGMGNWDNSCYQNSVAQGLASLRTLQPFLESVTGTYSNLLAGSTNEALLEMIRRLNGGTNNGKVLWMIDKLKSMSTWQQQDAQEYFSKIMDDLDKELLKASGKGPTLPGINVGAEELKVEDLTSPETKLRNPLEGFLGQRVACTQCGHSEGLSLIPFNCLTVPLGKDYSYDVRACLDEYTKLEAIEGVDCAKCTLLRTSASLEAMMERTSSASTTNKALLKSITTRLEAVKGALGSEDFSDKTLSTSCQISKKNWMSTTKSRQAVIARAPKSLVIHINRSVFNEMTGAMTKNYAPVSFPAILDLGPWCLGRPSEQGDADGKELKESWTMDPRQSMLPGLDTAAMPPSAHYELRSIITHYGRHENGHYISYRKHASPAGLEDSKEQPPERWWMLSDEDVSPVSEGDVLECGDVFMLFYDQITPSQDPEEQALLDIAISVPLPADDEDLVQEEPVIEVKLEDETVEEAERDEEENEARADSAVKSRSELLQELRGVLPRPAAETELAGDGTGADITSSTSPSMSSSALESDVEDISSGLDDNVQFFPSKMSVPMRTAGPSGSLQGEDGLASPARLASAF